MKDYIKRSAARLAGLVVICAAAPALLVGCNGGNNSNIFGETEFGQALQVGAGTARSFVVLNNDNEPTSIGINFSVASLSNLPAEETSFVLPLPAQVMAPPYNHLTLDWNPHGHDPVGVNDVPHFDAHFYMISPEERAQIGFAPDAPPPAPQFIPQDYVSGHTVVPNMGQHWIDPTDPANQPGGFDKTLIYGFNNGQMNFIEPMFTTAFLNSQPNFSGSIKRPAAYPKAGYYPSRYTIRYVAETLSYIVALEGLQFFDG